MQRLRPIMFAVALLMPVPGGSAETCPWLNAATAGGVLGAAVTGTVTHENANRDDAACEFIQVRGHHPSELRIGVLTVDTPKSEFESRAAECGSDATRLNAIGNEAVICTPADGRSGWLSARVVGRVRNRLFIIVVSTTESSTTLSSLRDKARDVAEQVAGNLF